MRRADAKSPVAASPQIISAMVDRIVHSFEPSQVILFGSWARGTANEWSDVDLLVIFPSLEDEREMAISIHESLSGMSVCKDILVSTPDEIRRRGHIVGTVLCSALNEGRVLYGDDARPCRKLRMSEEDRVTEGQRWLRHAKDDLDVATRLLADSANHPCHTCYYAQQAAEKSLKAALTHRGIDFPRGHDLDDLADLLPSTSPVRLARISLARLTRWEVEGRYPGEWDEATETDATTALGQAKRVHDLVEAEFGCLLDEPEPREEPQSLSGEFLRRKIGTRGDSDDVRRHRSEHIRADLIPSLATLVAQAMSCAERNAACH